MRIVLFDDDGNEVAAVEDVEKVGLEIVNAIGGVSLSHVVRATLSGALYPYWVHAQAPAEIKSGPVSPPELRKAGEVVAFKPRGQA